MMILYCALLECVFHKPTPKVIAPSPRIVSLPCFEMMLGWARFCSNDIKELILTDIGILLENKSNLEILEGNLEFLSFVIYSVYSALATGSDRLLRAAEYLLKTLFRHIFLTDADAGRRFRQVLKWPWSLEDCEESLQLLAVRVSWTAVVESVHEAYSQNSSNDTLWESNFGALCLITEQIVYSHLNAHSSCV